ncbi:hypothetical protein LXL04_031378 [Taraxacum kok-saghyz]
MKKAAYQVINVNYLISPVDILTFIVMRFLDRFLRHDSADTIQSALDLGVNVKMITGAILA